MKTAPERDSRYTKATLLTLICSLAPSIGLADATITMPADPSKGGPEGRVYYITRAYGWPDHARELQKPESACHMLYSSKSLGYVARVSAGPDFVGPGSMLTANEQQGVAKPASFYVSQAKNHAIYGYPYPGQVMGADTGSRSEFAGFETGGASEAGVELPPCPPDK